MILLLCIDAHKLRCDGAEASVAVPSDFSSRVCCFECAIQLSLGVAFDEVPHGWMLEPECFVDEAAREPNKVEIPHVYGIGECAEDA